MGRGGRLVRGFSGRMVKSIDWALRLIPLGFLSRFSLRHRWHVWKDHGLSNSQLICIYLTHLQSMFRKRCSLYAINRRCSFASNCEYRSKYQQSGQRCIEPLHDWEETAIPTTTKAKLGDLQLVSIEDNHDSVAGYFVRSFLCIRPPRRISL
ncbi:hypothetical protein MPH_01559 [Macrophomina phaseolina MS6]|uniref:Uncharacterized protein n=1 Tax=Macrophomina phaseolina (strain MS6) TaxID=1126212 RepID=K2RF38_MACPH|nr:hypothetical protein MPH_01559 [Macrophomina phaseolina MS6]